MALADLLISETAKYALAHRDIRTVFRILRGAGVSQACIALATGQKQSEVSEIISGRQVQSVALLERIADGLGVPRGILGLAYTSNTTSATQEDLQPEQCSNQNLLRHAATILSGSPIFGIAHPIRVQRTRTPALLHVEGCVYLALHHFDRALAPLAAAVDGAGHAVGCTVDNSGLPVTAQLRCGELQTGLRTVQRVVGLAKGLRSVSVIARLKPLQEAAAAWRDSACQDLAREMAMLRRAA